MNKCLLYKTFLSFHFVIKTSSKGKFQSTSALRHSLGLLLLFIYLENHLDNFCSHPSVLNLRFQSTTTHSYKVVLFFACHQMLHKYFTNTGPTCQQQVKRISLHSSPRIPGPYSNSEHSLLGSDYSHEYFLWP